MHSTHHQNINVKQETFYSLVCVDLDLQTFNVYSLSTSPSGSKLWVLHRDPRGAAVQQRKAAQQWRPMGGWDSCQHTGRLPVQIDSLSYLYTARKDVSYMKMILWSSYALKRLYVAAPIFKWVTYEQWSLAASDSVVRTEKININAQIICLVLWTWMILHFMMLTV